MHVYKTEDPEEAYNIFADAYKEMHNNNIPIRRVSLKLNYIAHPGLR